jgi:hypothetical protein
VKLTVEGLRKLGITATKEHAAELTEMDHYENIPELLDIGRKGAEQLSDKNIPTKFDI